MKSLDAKKVSRVIIYTMLVIGILRVIVPIIIGAGYTYPCEDDFSWEMGGKILSEKYGGFLGALVGAFNYYRSTQGTYLANFLWHFIRPYDRAGMLGIQLAVISLIIFLIFAIGFLMKSMVKEWGTTLALALIAYIIVFNTSRFSLEQEFLYWYTGNINYALSTSLACITLGITVLIKREENLKRGHNLAVLGAFTGFLASGCSLQVTSFNCSWLLLMLLLCYKEVLEKKIIAYPFAGAFLGALINACAPGYHGRIEWAYGEAEYGILDALKDTVVCWKHEWNIVIGTKFLIILLLISFIICIVCKVTIYEQGISTGKMLFLIPAMVAIQYFSAFPVVLGYRSSDLCFSRTTYTYELLVKFTLFFIVISFAQWFREHVKVSVFVPSGVALVLIAVIIFKYNITDEIKQGYSYNVAKELKEGTIQEVYEFREKVLELVANSEKGTDVYLRVPAVPGTGIMYGMGLTEEPCSCNEHVAIYFGFESVAVEYSEAFEFPTQ